MAAEDIIEQCIQDVYAEFNIISDLLAKLKVEKDTQLKNHYDKEINDRLVIVERLLIRKFGQRTIDRAGDRKKEFENSKMEIQSKIASFEDELFQTKENKPARKPKPIHKNILLEERRIKSKSELLEENIRKEETIKRKYWEHSPKEIIVEIAEPHQAILEVLSIQEETIHSISRMKGINEETLRIAIKCSQKLSEQTEKMEKIQEHLDDLGDGLSRAKKEVSSVMRGIATDKMILCVICTIVILGIILIGIRLGFGIYNKVNNITTPLFSQPVAQKPIKSS